MQLFKQNFEFVLFCVADIIFLFHRAALCDDVTPGGFDIQSKDNRTSHSAIHSVITSNFSCI